MSEDSLIKDGKLNFTDEDFPFSDEDISRMRNFKNICLISPSQEYDTKEQNEFINLLCDYYSLFGVYRFNVFGTKNDNNLVIFMIQPLRPWYDVLTQKIRQLFRWKKTKISPQKPRHESDS